MFRTFNNRTGRRYFQIVATVILVTMVMAALQPVTQTLVQAQGETIGFQPEEAFSEGGNKVKAAFTADPAPITPELRKELSKAVNHSHRDGPDIGAAVDVIAPSGEGLPEPSSAANAADALTAADPSTFTIFRDTVLPIGAVGNSWGNVSSRAHEPSTGVNGKYVFQTGNWYASRSTDNGATWTYVNPSTLFGNHPTGNISFCCDQVTLYDPLHEREWWVLQYGTGAAGQGGLKIANSSGTSLFTNWCYYDIDATWFGYANASDAGIDYNDMAVSRNFLYISSNLFPAAGGQLSGILKLPIDNMITCSGFGYSRWTDPTHFTFKLVQGANKTMYWGSNWANTGGWTCTDCINGNGFRVYQWPESTNTISWWDRKIDPFVFYKRNTGQNCASATGAVKNWCQFSDSRVLGGAVTDGVIHFTFNAKQTTNRPFPYTRWVRFSESSKGYQGYWDLFGTWGALLFLSITPNNGGNIGGTFAFGGGTGTTNYYPSGGLLLNDDKTTDIGNSWSNGINYFLPGAGNPCTSSGFYRWGDYLTVRPFYPAGYAFVAANFAIKGGSCGALASYSEPHNTVFGRQRDLAEYNRWKLK